MKSESDYTAELVKALRAAGAVVYTAWAGKRVVKGKSVASGQEGFPDRHVTHHLWTGWLELKLIGGALSEKQITIIGAMNRQRPGSALVGWFNEATGYDERAFYVTDETDTWALGCDLNKIDEVLRTLGRACDLARSAVLLEASKRKLQEQT